MSKTIKKERPKERPFEKLLRRDGRLFETTVVENWYLAREYVLYKLRDVKIGPSSRDTLTVTIEIGKGDQANLMLSVVRQVALVAHYPNYVEYDQFGKPAPQTHTVVKIITQDSEIVEKLNKEECLNNLLKYCHYQVEGKEQNLCEDVIPIDVDINIVEDDTDKEGSYVVKMSYSDFENLGIKADGIDTRMAVLASRVYDLGADIDNLPYEDIHDAGRYSRALNVFEHRFLTKEIEELVTKEWDTKQDEKQDERQVKVRSGLSNIFFADRFRSIDAGMEEFYKKERAEFCKKCEKNIHGECKKTCEKCGVNKVTIASCWEQNDLKLALSEHARWIVEKLILGFRPMNSQERNRYENLLGSQRKAYVRLLKSAPSVLYKAFPEDYGNDKVDPTHLNLCSFRELRRIDPDNRKYDSFLILAIPMILKRISEDDKE